jgi:hypothetical protein
MRLAECTGGSHHAQVTSGMLSYRYHRKQTATDTRQRASVPRMLPHGKTSSDELENDVWKLSLTRLHQLCQSQSPNLTWMLYSYASDGQVDPDICNRSDLSQSA